MKYKLKEISEIICGGTPSTNNPTYWNGSILWVTPKDLSLLNGAKYIQETAQNISEEGVKSSSAKIVPANSVILSTRAPVGYVGISKFPMATNQGIKSIIVNQTIADAEYVYYLLLTQTKNLELKASGSTFKELSTDSLKNYEIDLPSIDQQHSITNILGTLDKRLELCRRITANLLKKLDELYDYYFGDGNQSKQNCFGHDFFEILSGYPFDSSTYSKGKYKIITIKSIKMNDFDTLTADCVETIPLSIDAKCVLTCGDILISLTGDTGRIAIVDEKDCLLNQRVGKILCEDEYKIYTYALLRSQYAQRYISKNSVGTSQKNISPIILSNIKTYLPDEDELKIFNSLAIPMFQKYVAEQERAKNIIQIKNSILPLLMNGQIQVIN